MRTQKAYLRYKDCGIEWLGQIPEHWEKKRLKHVVDLRSEKAATIDAERYIGMENLESWTGRLVETDLEVQAPGDKFELDDVLFGKLRPYLAKAMIAHSAGQCSSEFLIMVPDGIETQFLHFVILSDGFIYTVDSSTYGTKMPRANWETVGVIGIPIPTKCEQQAIADFLDGETAKIDALMEKKERLIELLKEKRTALISHAVTKGLNPDAPMKDSSIEWLGRIPAHWEVVCLRHILIDRIAGPFGSSLTKDLYGGGTYRVYGQEQVIPGNFAIGDYYIPEKKFREMSRFQVSTGDVLLSCVGTFGRAAVVPSSIEPGIINPRLILLRPNVCKVHSEYLELFLKSGISFSQMDERSRGGTMDIINLSLVSDLVVPLPPLDQQQTIRTILDREVAKIDALISKVQEAIDLVKEYRTALISAAVTGKIDVREEVTT